MINQRNGSFSKHITTCSIAHAIDMQLIKKAGGGTGGGQAGGIGAGAGRRYILSKYSSFQLPDQIFQIRLYHQATWG